MYSAIQWNHLKTNVLFIELVSGLEFQKASEISFVLFLTENSIFCVTPNDDRWQPMCSNAVSHSSWDDSLLGEEECRSPFGTYELVIPVEDQLSCDDPGITNKNCRDLDVRNPP